MSGVYRVGEVEIQRITEKVFDLPMSVLYSDHAAEIERQKLEQAVELSVHSWAVRTPRKLIVIDTGIGNGRDRGGNPLFHDIHTAYPDRLAAAGIDAAGVDLVLLTHLHTDHVGWNTTWDGHRWTPMFPNATYVFSAKELAAWQSDPSRAKIMDDSIQPVLDAGLVETIDPADYPVFDNVFTYYPSPGHSLDHASITLGSKDEYALFGGDVLHHPIQAWFPYWNSRFCEDKSRAEMARSWALDWCLRNDALYLSSHFSETSVGRILGTDETLDGYNWQFV